MVDGFETGLQVTHALDYLRSSGGEDLRSHYLWVVKALMTRMTPEDLSTESLVSLVAILVPEHARFIEGKSPTARPAKVLSIVRETAAAN